MKKQRWLSLVLILALVVGLCSVCAAAADDQTAEQPAQEAADTVAEAEAAPADGTQPDAAAAEANTETAEQPEQDAAAETDAAAEEAPADGTHIHAVNREDACEEPAFEPLTVRGGQLESGCYYLTEDWTLQTENGSVTADPPDVDYGDDNNNSVVTTVTWRGESFLLLGDAKKDRMNEQLDKTPETLELIKLPHHGDGNKPLLKLIGQTRPCYAVATVSPAEEVEDKLLAALAAAGTQVFRTDGGAVSVEWTDGGFTVMQ